MKKGKGKKNKGQIKKSAPRFHTLWLRDEKDITRLIVRKPDQPPSQLTPSAVNMSKAFPHSHEELIDTGPPDKKPKVKASVTCITSARKKSPIPPKVEKLPDKVKEIPRVVKPKPMSRREKKRLLSVRKRMVRDECAAYARWAAIATKSRDSTELSYYSKLEYRFWMKTMKRQAMEDAAAMVWYGPPAPPLYNTAVLCLTKQEGVDKVYSLAPKKLPQAKPSNGHSFATKPRKVTQCNANQVTQCNQHKPTSVMTATQYEVGARNNPAFTPSVADVKWYINNVSPPDWPEFIREHTYYLDSGYRPDKAKILGKSKMSLQVQFDELENDYSALQMEHWNDKATLIEKNEELQEQIGLLYQELALAHDQVKVKGFNEAHSKPDNYVSKINPLNSGAASATGKPPIKSLALQFGIYKNQHNDNPLRSFLRSSGHGIEREKELRGYFDWQCEARLRVSESRNLYKQLACRPYFKPRKAVRVKLEVKALRRIGNNVTLCNTQEPDRIRNMIKIHKERRTLQGWANRTGTLSRGLKYLDNQSKFEQLCIDESNRQLMNTTTYKVLKGVKDIAMTEVNPLERKRKKEKAKRGKVARKENRIELSRIKRMAEEQTEADILRETIREAQRIAH